MTRDEFAEAFVLGHPLTHEGVKTFVAQEKRKGRLVMVHELGDTSAEEQRRIAGRLESLPPKELALVIANIRVDGEPIVVTKFLVNFSSLDAWLESVVGKGEATTERRDDPDRLGQVVAAGVVGQEEDSFIVNFRAFPAAPAKTPASAPVSPASTLHAPPPPSTPGPEAAKSPPIDESNDTTKHFLNAFGKPRDALRPEPPALEAMLDDLLPAVEPSITVQIAKLEPGLSESLRPNSTSKGMPEEVAPVVAPLSEAVVSAKSTAEPAPAEEPKSQSFTKLFFDADSQPALFKPPSLPVQPAPALFVPVVDEPVVEKPIVGTVQEGPKLNRAALDAVIAPAGSASDVASSDAPPIMPLVKNQALESVYTEMLRPARPPITAAPAVISSAESPAPPPKSSLLPIAIVAGVALTVVTAIIAVFLRMAR